MVRRYGTVLWVFLLTLAASNPAFAKDDRVSFGSDIVVTSGSTAGDLVCLFCNIRVHGDVRGNVVAVLGSVSVEDQRSISGDLVTVGGDTTLGSEATVHGDLAVVAGDLTRGDGASVGGEVSVVQGRGWLLVPLAPLAIFIGIIWMVVWLTRRTRYRFPMYPQGRGF